MLRNIPSPRYKWLTHDPMPADAHGTLAAYPPHIQPLLFHRDIHDIETAEMYFHQKGSLYDPFLIKGMSGAVDLIFEALEASIPIAVYGDYDADGVTASCLMTQVLKCFGDPTLVRHYIPDRFEEGYGLNSAALKYLFDEGIGLVITVDCGIRSVAEADFARKLGLTMIISDHHEPGEEIPSADFVICPKLPGNTYPEINLSGVGIAFKIAEAMFKKHPKPGLDATHWMDLAAIGTVADMVPLLGENRSIVRGGIQRLRQHPRPGVLALGALAGFQASDIRSTTIGYTIGPRLNASGRLDSAELSFNLLDAPDLNQAQFCAEAVNRKNIDRQTLTREIQKRAKDQLNPTDIPACILIQVDEVINDTPIAGVVGLAAAKIEDEYYRPAIVGARGEKYTRASCRSIPEFNMIEALDQCADLLDHHGGHHMAAGLTIANDKWDLLKSRMNAIAEKTFTGMELYPSKTADMEFGDLSYITMDLLNTIDRMEPVGEKNPAPLYILRNLKPVSHRTMGKERQHFKMNFPLPNGSEIEAVAFNMGEWNDAFDANPNLHVDLLFNLERNSYKQSERLQLNIMDIHVTEGQE